MAKTMAPLRMQVEIPRPEAFLSLWKYETEALEGEDRETFLKRRMREWFATKCENVEVAVAEESARDATRAQIRSRSKE